MFSGNESFTAGRRLRVEQNILEFELFFLYLFWEWLGRNQAAAIYAKTNRANISEYYYMSGLPWANEK